MPVHEVENPLPEVVKHANLHCMEEVGIRQVVHNTGTVSKHIESWLNMARRLFSIGYHGRGIPEHSL